MNVPEIMGWVVMGLLAGAIARALVPGDDKSGCLVTVALGIAGALVGGWLGRYTGIVDLTGISHPWVPSIASLVTAVIGTVVLLSLLRFLRQ